jgi:hypothetical protein
VTDTFLLACAFAVISLLVAFTWGAHVGARQGRKAEREAILGLWYTWFQGVRSYTLNLFSGAITEGEHLLPYEQQRMTTRYLDVTTPRDQ